MLKVGTGFRKTSSARRDAAVAERPMRCSAALPSLTRGSSKCGRDAGEGYNRGCPRRESNSHEVAFSLSQLAG